MRNRASLTIILVTGKVYPRKCLLSLLNARSMLIKIHYIRLPTLSSNFDFMRITETWPNNHTHGNPIVIPGYKPFGKSREAQRGGECFVSARDFIATILCQDSKLNTAQDAVWITAEIGNEGLLIKCVYRPLVFVKMILDDNQTDEYCFGPTKSRDDRQRLQCTQHMLVHAFCHKLLSPFP